MNKLYVYLVVLIIVVGFIKWGHTQVWEQGYNAHKAEVADKKDESVAKDKVAVKEIIKWREKKKVIYRDKIKKIYIAKDATGCADVKLTDMGFGL